MLLDTIRTVGIIVGIIYYLSILRNQQKTRTIDMASRRAEQLNNFDFQMMIRKLTPLYSGWSTPEEYYKKYNYKDTPELNLSRAIIQNSLNHWGFLYREGIISLNFIERLHNPWHIIRFWETFKPLLINEREVMGNSEVYKDLEYLYDELKKKYPNLSKDTRFTFQSWEERET